MPITEILSSNAKKYPNEVSLIECEPSVNSRREISWQDFENMSNKFANALLSYNLNRGERVAILMMNCLEWLPFYFGILKTGALAVPLNFRFTAKEIKKSIDTVKAKVLVYGPEFREKIEEIRGQIPSVKTYVFIGEETPANTQNYIDLLNQFPSRHPDIKISDNDDAALYFTSGTTGAPKPILLTHHNLLSACITEQKHHLQNRQDNFLCIPPLYHTGAKMHWFGSLISGSKAVILRGVKPKWILETVFKEKVTIVWLLVPWAQDILDAIENGEINLNNYDLKQWRLMHIGAQPVPPSLIKRWKKYFPNQLYDTNYGLSEATGPGCVHLGIQNIHKVGSIGLPGFNWHAKIVNEDGEPVLKGQVGELIVKGPGVMKCYYNNLDATSKVLKGGWLYTGDLAKQDEDGFIYLVDRKRDIIISGGENLFPVEIENYLRTHGDIKDAAVIGMPDRRLGEVPIAVIETKPGKTLTEETVLDMCKDLPRYKRPRKIVFDKIPRNPTGKIEKPKLREKYLNLFKKMDNAKWDFIKNKNVHHQYHVSKS